MRLLLPEYPWNKFSVWTLLTRVSYLEVKNNTGNLHFPASSTKSKSVIENWAFFLIDLLIILIIPEIINYGNEIYSWAISIAIFCKF